MTQIEELLGKLTPAQRDSLMDAAVREAQRRTQNAARPSYSTPDGIIQFVRQKLRADPTAYQERILRALVEKRRVAVRSPHGAGKSALAAWVVLWGLSALGDDTKIATTASVFRQVKYLWREIHKWVARADLMPRPTVLDMSLRIDGSGVEAFGIASDNPYTLEGVHGDNVLLIFDEAKAIDVATFDALEGALSTGNTYALMLSTPGLPSGRFYNVFRREQGLQDWYPIHITLAEAIEAGRINPEWAEARRQQWGETSALYLNRVLGEFADSDENSVIPLSWVEAANERHAACNGVGTGDLYWGCDPARFGADVSVIAQLRGRTLEKLHRAKGASTMEVCGRLINLVGSKHARLAVDSIGLGAGLFDRLKELEFANAIGVNVSRAPVDENEQPIVGKGGQEFANLRAALWWLLREALDPEGPDPLALPPDDKLTGDLTAPTFQYTSTGRIKIESKDDIRQRIGRSTDDADALALALYAAYGMGRACYDVYVGEFIYNPLSGAY